VVGTSRHKKYTVTNTAVEAVRQGLSQCVKPLCLIKHNKKRAHSPHFGGQPVFSDQEQIVIAKNMATLGDWSYTVNGPTRHSNDSVLRHSGTSTIIKMWNVGTNMVTQVVRMMYYTLCMTVYQQHYKLDTTEEMSTEVSMLFIKYINLFINISKCSLPRGLPESTKKKNFNSQCSAVFHTGIL